ncbi:lysylphosphatidylglycerol synthase domain-containing protein [Lacinutrix chionoecetis]
MHYALSYKTKQFFFVLIKLSIVVGAFYFIYNKLVNNGTLDFYEFAHFLNKNNVFSLKNMFYLLFLSLLNWFLEILKWQTLVSSVKNISFLTATQQSLGALTASLFTPNRIGEYGAKAVYFAKPYRKRILLLNLIGNIMQMAVTVTLGIIGFLMFVQCYNIEINTFKVSRLVIIFVVVLGLSIAGIKQKKYKIKGFSIEKVKQFVSGLPLKISGFAFLFSLLRYAVFSFQFYYILQLFGVEIVYLQAMIIITSMYLLASIIPSLFIFDVIIKGSVAVYLFSFAGVNEFTILCVITTMWLLNFVLPSVFGSYYVLNFNFQKKDAI